MTALATRELAIRALTPGAEQPPLFAALARLLADAYPTMRLTSEQALADRAQTIEENLAQPGVRWIVAERDGTLVGAMRLYDYTMNVRGRDAFTGGVGSLAVSRLHKRQGIARTLIAWYLDDYRSRGATFAVLHPFRLDFYRALGFGYGTPVHRFAFAPATLRDDGARGTTRFLGEADLDALLACYERVRAKTNGLIAKHRAATALLLGDPALRYVGVEDAGVLRGFMQTSVQLGGDGVVNRDALVVRDLAYEDRAARAALFGHLRAQQDQLARITIETQDAALYLASGDPRDGSDRSIAPPVTHRVAQTGLGIMYRILDLEAAFAHLPAAAAPFALEVAVDDAFLPAAGGASTFRVGPAGAPRLDATAQPDARLTIGVADLSSVVMGSLRLRDVVNHGLASLEPASRLAEVDAALRADQPPLCTTRF